MSVNEIIQSLKQLEHPVLRFLVPLRVDFRYDDQSDAVIATMSGRVLTLTEIEQLLEHCRKFFAHYGEDVAETINVQIDQRQLDLDADRAKQIRIAARQTGFPGYVYLMYSPVRQHYKIGRSSNPTTRRAAVSVKQHHKVETVHLIESSNCIWAERELQGQFQAKCLGSEWYALDNSDVTYIKSIERMDP